MKHTHISTWARTIPAAVGAVCLLLTGCGAPGGQGDGADGGKVTISLDWWGSDARVKSTQQAVAAFEKEHPNIKVEMQYSDWSGYWDKLATSIVGGNAPDVIQIDETYLAAYASQGSLYDLGSMDGAIDTSDIEGSVMDMGKYDGTQYAVPIATTPQTVMVNMDALAKAGVQLPDDADDWTYDEFADFQKQVYDSSGGEIRGAGMGYNAYALRLWARQNGEELFTDGKVSISEDALTKYFDIAKELVDTGFGGDLNAWSEQTTATLNQSDFGTGRGATMFSQATQLTAYADAVGTKNIKLVMPPSNTKDKWGFMGIGMYWSITSKSKHPKEAAELIDFLVNSEEAGKILGTERGIPVNAKVRQALADSASDLDREVLDYADAFEKKCGKAPEIIPNGMSDIMNTAMRYQQEVMFGRQTSREAAKAMIKELQTAIDNAS